MTKRNRKTLKDNFADGKMPTEEAFSDLIDSAVNIVDDGFDKTAVEGMKVAQLDDNSRLVSFYDEITVKDPLWSISFANSRYAVKQKNLTFRYGRDQDHGVFIAGGANEDGDEGPSEGEGVKVGINVADPEYALDVGGVVAADGRIGRPGKPQHKVPADGAWYPIITGLDGCHAFEVMAGVGRRRSGKYALLHAFALNTFNSKKGNITHHQAYFSSKCDRIDLRWVGDTHNYSLEMRARCDYGEELQEKIYIRYYITRLWFDPFMDASHEDGQDGGSPALKG